MSSLKTPGFRSLVFPAGQNRIQMLMHWDSIPDRESTIEQALFRMSNGLISWPHVSNALMGKEIRPEILELMHRIVERLRKNEMQLGECTKPIREFIDACINSEATMMAWPRILQQPIIVQDIEDKDRLQ